MLRNILTELRERLSGLGAPHFRREESCEKSPLSFEKFLKMKEYDDKEDSLAVEADADPVI